MSPVQPDPPSPPPDQGEQGEQGEQRHRADTTVDFSAPRASTAVQSPGSPVSCFGNGGAGPRESGGTAPATGIRPGNTDRTQSATADPGAQAAAGPGSPDPGGPHNAPAPLDLSQLNRYDASVGSPAPPYDPLRLCVFTTVALIAWVLGPIAVFGFALIAIAGYARARRQGLLRSKCKLGDTRLVLAYLTALAVLAAVATPFWVMFWIGRIG